MKKILITGIAGFIGSHTAKKMKAMGYEVIGVDNFNNYYDPKIKRERAKNLESIGIEIIERDLINDEIEDLFSKNSISAVLHIAASAGVRPSIEQPEFFVQNNVLVTTKLLNVMRKFNVKNLVFASSSSVYGNLIKDTSFSIKEDDIKDDIFSPYAATKLACEKMISAYVNMYKMNAISLRYFTVFGPDQRPDLAIMKFMQAAINDKKIEKFGDGNTFRDYTYIDDVVEANILSIEKNASQINLGIHEHNILNICSNNPISLNDLIAKISTVTGKKLNVMNDEMKLGDVFGTFGNFDRAKKLIGWYPKTNFDDGLKNMFDWVKKTNEGK